MSRFGYSLLAAATALGISGCSESPTGVSAPEAPVTRNLVSVPGAAYFGFTPNNNRVEFWDNPSVDGSNCNVGFFVVGPFGPCNAGLPGSLANAATFGASEFYGINADGADPTPVMFEPGDYEVTFIGGFRGFGLEPVGWFTKTAGVYTLTPIAPAISSQINSVVTFTTDKSWGFWIDPQNTINGGDACVPDVMCSDDTKVQQFAVFKKLDNSMYFVGIEDQPGVPTGPGITPTSSQFPSGGGDKDFNDFFLTVKKLGPTESAEGRMTGGGGSDALNKLSVSLTIHCDNKLSNNINITWGTGKSGQKWHLDKNSLTNIICELTQNPAPPVAPINIFKGDATGTLNNVSGSRLSFMFMDNGEPNQGGDRVSLKIWDANNNVVLDIQDVPLDRGNFQAHFDQPHGKGKNK